MPLTTVLPPPEVPDNECNPEDKRLWIGNLDPHITDLTCCSTRLGPWLANRGIRFCDLRHGEDAQSMMNAIHGKIFGSKTVAVRWARTMTKTEMEKKPKVGLKIPALVGAKEEKKMSREIQIQAIESKLKMMEHNSANDLIFSNEPSTSSGLGNLHNTSVQTKNPVCLIGAGII